MAATVDSASREIFADGHEVVTQMQLSVLTAGLTESIAHNGPSGARVSEARMEIITQPNDDSPVMFAHLSGTDSTTNNTVAVRFDTAAGGSLTGAVVRVLCKFRAMKAGGIGSNTYVSPVT